MKDINQKSVGDNFPPLEEETVFVATPGDLTGVRAQIERVVRRLATESTRYSNLRPYSWDLDIEGTGFDQHVSMQRQIPRPADPLCRGTICVLSERIGSPLEEDFPLSLCPAAQQWTDTEQRYKLKHPWPQDVGAQTAALETGSFPLTGTVWEFLDACHAGVPVFLGFMADGLLYQAYAAQGVEAHQKWVQLTYLPQIRALRNFAGAVNARGIAVKPYDTDASLIDDIYKFVWAYVLRQTVEEGRTPFKGLDYYDIEDGDVFYGRDLLRDSVVRDIDELAESGATRKAVGLIGVSGSGKSSVLRAGVLHKLQALAQRGRYHVMAVRPTDFQNEHGTPENIIPRILSSFVTSTTLKPPDFALAKAVAAPANEAARAAVNLICDTLPPAKDGEPSKLVIGLDQLEEIVDDLMGKPSESGWNPLIEFLKEARKRGVILFVYTLDAGRAALVGKTRLDEFVDELFQHKVANGPEFWREIVSRPFRAAGISLTVDFRKRLLDAIDVLTKERHEAEVSALLPLVALTLSKIYNKAKDKKERHDKQVGTSRRIGETRQRFELDASEFESDEFDIEKAIAREASEAVRETWGIGTPDPDDVNHLLRPFIRLSEGPDAAITLRAAAISGYASERAIIGALLKRRLIIKVESSRYRLVHEAMLHHWGPAKEWLAKVRDELRVETEMRMEAAQWNSNKRKLGQLRGSKDRIDRAADLLSSYIRYWSGGSELIGTDEVLKDYSLALLKRSKTPSAIVRSSAMASTHAHIAAAYGRVDILKSFAACDIAAVDARREGDKATPLLLASFGEPKAVTFLLECGASATSRTKKEWRPIHAAIYGNNEEVFNLLLTKYEVEQLVDGPEQSTVLHHCARNNRRRMVRKLIEERGVSVNTCNDDGTPLHWAALEGHLDIVRDLLALTAVTSTDKWGRTPLHCAAAQGSADVIDLLLSRYQPNTTIDRGAPGTDPPKSTALHIAARARKGSAVKRLLADARTDPNATESDGHTPLSLAIDDPGIRADLLEDERIDVWRPIQSGGPNPLEICIAERNWSLCLRMLQLASAASVDDTMPRDGYQLFSAAISNGAPPNVLRSLAIALREQIDRPNARGLTPLMAAAEEGSLQAIQLVLKETAADLRFATPTAGTAMLVALKNRARSKVVEALWAGNVSELRVVDDNGWTPLHVAAINSDDIVAGWLLAHGGTDLTTAKDRWTRTPENLASPSWSRQVLHTTTADDPTPVGSWDQRLNWQPLDAAERDLVYEAIEQSKEVKRLSQTAFDRAALSFYPSERVSILRLSDPNPPLGWHAYHLVITSPSMAEPEYIRLDGTSSPIHDVNTKAPLMLTPAVVCDYLRFFCFFTHGRDGPFLIVEGLGQREISPHSELFRNELAKHLRPVRYWGWSSEDDGHRASALVYYGSVLFFADFVIKPSGSIRMLTDQTVLTGLPELSAAAIA